MLSPPTEYLYGIFHTNIHIEYLLRILISNFISQLTIFLHMSTLIYATEYLFRIFFMNIYMECLFRNLIWKIYKFIPFSHGNLSSIISTMYRQKSSKRAFSANYME